MSINAPSRSGPFKKFRGSDHAQHASGQPATPMAFGSPGAMPPAGNVQADVAQRRRLQLEGEQPRTHSHASADDLELQLTRLNESIEYLSKEMSDKKEELRKVIATEKGVPEQLSELIESGVTIPEQIEKMARRDLAHASQRKTVLESEYTDLKKRFRNALKEKELLEFEIIQNAQKERERLDVKIGRLSALVSETTERIKVSMVEVSKLQSELHELQAIPEMTGALVSPALSMGLQKEKERVESRLRSAENVLAQTQETLLQAENTLRRAQKKARHWRPEDRTVGVRASAAESLDSRHTQRRVLGRGASGTVFDVGNGRVMKEFVAQQQHIRNGVTREQFLNEVKFTQLAMMGPASVQQFEYGVIQEGRGFAVILEFADGGTVQGVLARSASASLPVCLNLTEASCVRELHNLATQLHYLETVARIRHRDVKSDNILICGNHLKFSDYGVACEAIGQEQNNKPIGTMNTMAPERVRGFGSANSDVWSIGVVLYEVLKANDRAMSGDTAAPIDPFAIYKDHEIFEKPLTSLPTDPFAAAMVLGGLEQSVSFSPILSIDPLADRRGLLVDLIRRTMQPEESRIGLEALIRHPFFTSVGG